MRNGLIRGGSRRGGCPLNPNQGRPSLPPENQPTTRRRRGSATNGKRNPNRRAYPTGGTPNRLRALFERHPEVVGELAPDRLGGTRVRTRNRPASLQSIRFSEAQSERLPAASLEDDGLDVARAALSLLAVPDFVLRAVDNHRRSPYAIDSS